VSDIEQQLREHPFARGFTEEQMARLRECVEGEMAVEEDEFIFRAGGRAERLYLVTDGEVALEIHSPGRPPGIVQTVAGGEVLGWSWFFEPYRWAFDARAITPTRVIAVDGRQMRECADADRDLGFLLLKRMAQVLVDRLQATRLQLLDVYGSRT
jgi:CRP-like cAMP-binding protein